MQRLALDRIGMHNSMMQFALGVTLRGCSFMESSILNIQPNVNTVSPRAQVHRKPNFLRLFEVWAQGRDVSTIMENYNIETLPSCEIVMWDELVFRPSNLSSETFCGNFHGVFIFSLGGAVSKQSVWKKVHKCYFQ